MSADLQVFNSFTNFIKNISDLDTLVYSNSSLDVASSYNVKLQDEVGATDVSFIILDSIDDAPFTSDIDNLLVNRYFRFIDSNSNNVDIRIVDYDNTTGEITLESALGEIVSAGSTYNIEVLSSVFIRPLNKSTIGGQTRFSNRRIRFDMIIKTKEDSNKIKTITLQDKITTAIGEYRVAEIKDDLDNAVGYMNFADEPSYVETTDDEDQFIKYLGSVPVTYYVNNRN